MKSLCSSALIASTLISISAREAVRQKDIKSSTPDFLFQITKTIDAQYLVTGSSIPSMSCILNSEVSQPEMMHHMVGRQLQSMKTKNKVTKINMQVLMQGAYLVAVKTNDNKKQQVLNSLRNKL